MQLIIAIHFPQSTHSPGVYVSLWHETDGSSQTEAETHAEDPKPHRIPRGTWRIIPGMHNGPQRTVESQRDKTQAHDETQEIAIRSCTPSDPYHALQAPQQVQRIPKTPAAQPRNRAPPPPQTIHAPWNPQPPPPKLQAHSKTQATPMNPTRPRG